MALIVRIFFLFMVLPFGSLAGQPALVEIKNAAEKGDPTAQKKLAQRYEGNFDFANAERWYLKAAAQVGDADVLLALARFYTGGKPKMSGAAAVPADSTKAINLFTLAAIQGHTRAQHDLAVQYLNGKIVPRNKIRAYQLFRLSDMLTGRHYLERLILEMTREEIEWAEKAVKQFKPVRFESIPGIIRSQLKLQGVIGEKDKTSALINGRIVEVGSRFDIDLGGHALSVRCDWINIKGAHLSFDVGSVLLELR